MELTLEEVGAVIAVALVDDAGEMGVRALAMLRLADAAGLEVPMPRSSAELERLWEQARKKVIATRGGTGRTESVH